MISLVSDNHVDDNLKETLVYVYFGSTVNNRSKTWWMSDKHCRPRSDGAFAASDQGIYYLLRLSVPVPRKSTIFYPLVYELGEVM